MQQTFAYLILYPTTLLNSLIRFTDSLGFHLWIDLFLSNLYAFFSLALLHWLGTNLHYNVEQKSLLCTPNLRKSIQTFTIKYINCRFFLHAIFITLRKLFDYELFLNHD